MQLLILTLLVFAICTGPAITGWRFNAPHPPWTHPSPQRGYGGKNDVLIREGKFHDGVYRGSLDLSRAIPG
jgi:hypothetical protein